MASQVSESGNRPSFAKVVAMPPNLNNQNPVSQNTQSPESPGIVSPSMTALPEEAERSASQEEHHQSQSPHHVDNLDKAVQHLTLLERKDRPAGSDSADVGAESPVKAGDDTQTHLSNSSTKPTSFDSKSMASVTTFAMDEKESLRPDDSASVQAAEEDERLSGSISNAQNSRVGSETDGRLHQVPPMGPSRPIPGVLPTGAKLNDDAAPIGDAASNTQSEQQLHGFPSEPDEKLLEAMESPKDRLLLLQLEDKIINFIKDASEQSLELPPCNAFGRLLAHKLGDYYHLTHFVDNNVTSVRLHRTPWCRLPTPLSQLQPATQKTPPPNAPAMKIMRRTGQRNEKESADGSTAPSSSVPSKAASETGVEGSNEDAPSSAAATPAKERTTMTREEREAKYQEVRERIFRDFPESKASESPKSGDQSADISRSNSKTGYKRGPRQRTPLDDGFEARSQFNTYYYGTSYSAGQSPYNGMVHDGSFNAPNNFVVGPGATPNVPPVGPVSPMYSTHGNTNNMPQYPMNSPPSNQGAWQNSNLQQTPPFGYSSPAQVPSMMQQQNPMRSGPNAQSYMPPAGQYMQSSPPWGQTQPQPNFEVPAGQRNPGAMPWPNPPPHAASAGQRPYAYGQSPNRSFPQPAPGNQPQPAMHGTFGRPPFNPQSRSFAPGNNSHARFQESGAGPSASVGHLGSPAWQNNAENMSRSPMNSAPQPNHGRSNLPTSSQTDILRGKPNEGQDSIAKWGTPSHLPAKPPPSEVPSYTFDIMGRVSSSSPKDYSSGSSVQPMSGPLVVSGTSNRQKAQLQGGMATGM